MAIDIGRIFYQKFMEVMFGNPDIFPQWEDIGKVQQDAYRAGAVAVLQYIDEERDLLSMDNLELDLTKE